MRAFHNLIGALLAPQIAPSGSPVFHGYGSIGLPDRVRLVPKVPRWNSEANWVLVPPNEGRGEKYSPTEKE